MSDTNTVIDQAQSFKMTLEDTVKMLKDYETQAEASLSSLQKNIDSAQNQINEWKKLQLMILGQKQLIADIINKTVNKPDTTPASETTTNQQ